MCKNLCVKKIETTKTSLTGYRFLEERNDTFLILTEHRALPKHSG